MCDYQESVTDRQMTDQVIPMCRYASQVTQKLSHDGLIQPLSKCEAETLLRDFSIPIYEMVTQTHYPHIRNTLIL